MLCLLLCLLLRLCLCLYLFIFIYCCSLFTAIGVFICNHEVFQNLDTWLISNWAHFWLGSFLIGLDSYCVPSQRSAELEMTSSKTTPGWPRWRRIRSEPRLFMRNHEVFQNPLSNLLGNATYRAHFLLSRSPWRYLFTILAYVSLCLVDLCIYVYVFIYRYMYMCV